MSIPDRFDVTMVLNYYTPYVSGLTEAARLIAEGLTARGWRTAVVACRHDPRLPRYERIGGVHVFRAPVVATIGRGMVSPTFPWLAARLAARSNVLNLHLPMLEAALIRRLARTKPVVSTYHIDLWLPRSLSSGLATRVADASARATLRGSELVVVNSDDQARGSKMWPIINERPLRPIASPCADRGGGSPRLRDGDGLHVGFMGRIVEDKGIEYLIRAFRAIDDPGARLLIAGDYQTVAGGSNIDQLRAEAAGDPRIRFLGLLLGEQIRDFYASIDVFALPSVSESFGIVQAEAMMTGVPSVTTDLAGGRYPVVATGFGQVVPPRDPAALRAAILDLAGMPAEDREQGRKKAVEMFGVEVCLDAYEDAFRILTSSQARLT